MSDNVVSPIEVEAEIKQYTLVGDDIYVKRYTNENIPEWYRSLIENIIATDPTISDVNAALDYLTSVDNGYAIKLANLETFQSSTNTVLTTLQSSDSQKTALIADLQSTKIDAESAHAISIDAVQSYINGGSANAWFTNQVSTYASATQANSNSISTLNASVNGLSASVTDLTYVSVDENGYSLGASKLGTAPDGSIVGWSFADGTGEQSTFKVQADKFEISNSTTGYTPFSIDGSNVLFNGVVDFTNTNTYGTTTIDGSKITTGSIMAETLDADAINGKTINGAVINGTTINGSYINGSVIKTSWIDFSSSGYLTDWKYYTESSPPPSQYLDFFAKNPDGSHVFTDAPTNYYRLPTTLPVSSEPIINGAVVNDSGNIPYSASYYYNSDTGIFVWNGTIVHNNEPNGWIYSPGKLAIYPLYGIRRFKYKGVGSPFVLTNINSWNSYNRELGFRQINETASYSVIGSSLIFESHGIGQAFGNFNFVITVDGVAESKVIEYATSSGNFTLHGFTFSLTVSNVGTSHYYSIHLISLTPSIKLSTVNGTVSVCLYTNNINYLYTEFSNSTVKTWQFPTLKT